MNTTNIINPDVVIGDMCICSGVQEMKIPQGGKHNRQAEIRVRAFIDTPVVTATVQSMDSNGTLFTIWSIEIHPLGSETQIVFTAANVEIGTEVDYTFSVSYTVVGKIS